MIGFVLNKLAGFGAGFLAQWKLYTIIIAIVSTYIISIKIESANAKRQRTKANKELDKAKQSLTICKQTNTLNQLEIKELIQTNQDIIKKFNDAKKENNQAIKKLKNYENLQDDKIKKLLSKVSHNDCNNKLISDNDNKLLKQANSQN